MNKKIYIIILLVFFIAPLVISEQTNTRLGRGNSRNVPPGIPKGATHEDAFAYALKDPNIYIGVFEWASSGTIMPSGQRLRELPGYGDVTLRFSALKCVKAIKGEFNEPVIWYSRLPAPRGEGRPLDGNSSFIALRDSKWILAVKKTTKEEMLGRFGKEIEGYSYINENTFFDVLWYGYGALCLNWPEGREERKGLKKVSEIMVTDLEAITKVMPSIQKETKDANDTAVITTTSQELKNDLAKSILTKLTTEKVEKPEKSNIDLFR